MYREAVRGELLGWVHADAVRHEDLVPDMDTSDSHKCLHDGSHPDDKEQQA